MKYSLIRKLDVTNGPGIRCTVFVTGCTHRCESCFNEDLQDFNYGNDWDKTVEEEFISYVKNPVVVGINVLGGEPLQQLMDNSLSDLLKRIKDEFPEKTIWLWTGDIFEEAISNKQKMQIIKYCDVIIDGKFEIANRNIKLKYRGSSNQRVIDVKKSLKSGNTVVIEVDNQVIL